MRDSLGGCRVPKIPIDDIIADMVAERITAEEAAQRILPFVDGITFDQSKIPPGQRFRLFELNEAVLRARLKSKSAQEPLDDQRGPAPQSRGTT
jgi:hypothetical protein